VSGSQRERKFIGIHGVHLSVEDDYAHVAGITTRKRSAFHAVHHTLEDGRHEAKVDGTTHHRVDKHEFSAPRQVFFLSRLDVHLELLTTKAVACGIGHTLGVWLYDEMNLTKLPCSATLLLMTIFGLCLLRDGLSIWNLGFAECHIELLVVLQSPLQRAQMKLTLTVNNDLAQLLALFHHPRGVFLMHFQQRGHEFFHVLRIGGLHRTAVFGVGIFDEIISRLRAFAVERVAGFHVFEFHRATDIARVQLVDGYAVGSRAGINLPHTLLGTSVGIGQVVTGFHASAHHLEIGHLADVRLQPGLEEV